VGFGLQSGLRNRGLLPKLLYTLQLQIAAPYLPPKPDRSGSGFSPEGTESRTKPHLNDTTSAFQKTILYYRFLLNKKSFPVSPESFKIFKKEFYQ